MGVNSSGIVFYGAHLDIYDLKKNVPDLRWIQKGSRDRMKLEGVSRDLSVIPIFTEEGYDRVVFGFVCAIGETYRYVEYTKVVLPSADERQIIDDFFNEHNLDKPELLLTGSGYS